MNNNDTKTWWQSRTIWVQIVALIYVGLNAFGALPADLTQEEVVTTIMAVVAVATVILRLVTKTSIGGSSSNVG